MLSLLGHRGVINGHQGVLCSVQCAACTYTVMANTILYNTVWGTITKVPTINVAITISTTDIQIIVLFLISLTEKKIDTPLKTVFYARVCQKHIQLSSFLYFIMSLAVTIPMTKVYGGYHGDASWQSAAAPSWAHVNIWPQLPAGARWGQPRWGQGPPRAATIQHRTLFLTKYIWEI